MLNNAAKLNRLNEMQAEKKSCVRAGVIYCTACVYSYASTGERERDIYINTNKSEYIACVNVCVRTESWVLVLLNGCISSRSFGAGALVPRHFRTRVSHRKMLHLHRSVYLSGSTHANKKTSGAPGAELCLRSTL
jgi:hypothetical protein